MSERSQRARVVKALRKLDGFAVENMCLEGTPDVNYAEGWIELKWLKDWPKRESTIVRARKFNKHQRLFLEDRCRVGQAYLILQVEKTQEWLLFWGATAAKVVDAATQKELRQHALAVWKGRTFDTEIAECLSKLAS